MVKCNSCGCENNDGSQFCLYCGTRIQTIAPKSDYERIVSEQRQADALLKERQKRATIVVIALIAVLVIGFAFFCVRVSNADSRAEQLVEKYIKSHVIGASNITFVYTHGSCLKTEGFTRAEGFDVSGYLTLNGRQLSIQAVVNMRGIFDKGEIQSILVDYQEIYSEDGSRYIFPNPS